jgi:hypothetical protein
MLLAEVPRAKRLTRFNFDAPLIAAFMDRWRPETHTFHLLVGEMTLSLEDACDVGRTAVCWPGDGVDRHPRDVAG